jgi:hypothetical protein
MSTELGKQILEAVKSYVATHVERVLARVDQLATALEQLQTTVRSLPQPEKGERGEPGVAGQTPTSEELRGLIAPLIPQAIPGPPGPAGCHGEKGESPSEAQLLAIIHPLIPAPIVGPAGPPGEKGDTPTAEQLQAIVQRLIPPPVPGERGAPGERGERGAPGDRGADGLAPSADELRAIIAPLIPAPVTGERGADGINGKDGRDGTNGRDALDLEVLPEIDEARGYPRGTYARHAGGLWRSFESTLGMRGWECIVEGVADETETLLDDGRTVVRRTIYSSGRVFERSASAATVLDKGVYKADVPYAPGDAVTWAGSLWIAQRREASLPYGKPSTPGSGWRLAVKAGRDART